MGWFWNASPLDRRTAASVSLLKKQLRQIFLDGRLCPRLRVLLLSAVIVFGFCSVFISSKLRRIFVTQPVIGASCKWTLLSHSQACSCCLCISLYHTNFTTFWQEISRISAGASAAVPCGGLNQRVIGQHYGALRAKLLKRIMGLRDEQPSTSVGVSSKREAFGNPLFINKWRWPTPSSYAVCTLNYVKCSNLVVQLQTVFTADIPQRMCRCSLTSVPQPDGRTGDLEMV